MNAKEFAQYQREQVIANNDLWHKNNIEQYLPTYVEACRDCNAIWADKVISEYAEAESKRLHERAELMEKYGVERLPNAHGPLALEYFQQARPYIDANIARERAYREKLAALPHPPVQGSLWTESEENAWTS